MQPEPSHVALTGVRGLIDAIDDGLIVLLAGRRQLVALATGVKDRLSASPRDPAREHAVRNRARRLGRHLGVPVASSDRLMSVLIEDACKQQGFATGQARNETNCGRDDLDQGADRADQDMLPTAMPRTASSSPASSWLRLLPPPARLAPLLRRLPLRWQSVWLEAAMHKVLEGPLASGALNLLTARRIGIEVHDLGLRWVVCLRGGRMHVCGPDETAEATVSGSATDLLLLASRREDADTLFFQRRLKLTGDTELGLTARNLLDQLPWQDVPLGLRIVLHRGAGLTQSARAAYHGETMPE